MLNYILMVLIFNMFFPRLCAWFDCTVGNNGDVSVVTGAQQLRLLCPSFSTEMSAVEKNLLINQILPLVLLDNKLINYISTIILIKQNSSLQML